jgi:hypothetical protein
MAFLEVLLVVLNYPGGAGIAFGGISASPSQYCQQQILW